METVLPDVLLEIPWCNPKTGIPIRFRAWNTTKHANAEKQKTAIKPGEENKRKIIEGGKGTVNASTIVLYKI